MSNNVSSFTEIEEEHDSSRIEREEKEKEKERVKMEVEGQKLLFSSKLEQMLDKN